MKNLNQKLKICLSGAAAGFLNGLLGSGGGLIIVPMLNKLGLEPKKSHATSIAIILPLSVMSCIMYLIRGVKIEPIQLAILIPLGLVGAVIGSFMLRKIKNRIITKIFGLIMIASAIRILLK